jgi:hypothetical protein
MAGAAGAGSAAAAGRTLGVGGGGELIAHLADASAHQLFHPFLAAVRTLDFGVAAENQFFKILVTTIAVILKDWHDPNHL